MLLLSLIPDAHSLLFLADFPALLAVNLLALVLLPLLVLFLKQPRELGHKGADGPGNAGDVHWFYGIDSFGCIHRFCGVLFLQNGSIVIPVIRFLRLA